MTFDWLTLRLLALVATALMAGGMVFFSFIFAPLVFAKRKVVEIKVKFRTFPQGSCSGSPKLHA